MSVPMDRARFLAMRRRSEEALQLAVRAHEVLLRRDVGSFDGFGHFLDAILPDDAERLNRLALALDLSPLHLQRLRASRLDPFSLTTEHIVRLGQLLGIARDSFERLVARDHQRFAASAHGVTAREMDRETDERFNAIRSEWERWQLNEATGL